MKGRPRKFAHRFEIRCTKEDYENWSKAAGALGINLSEYLRRKANLPDPPPPEHHECSGGGCGFGR